MSETVTICKWLFLDGATDDLLNVILQPIKFWRFQVENDHDY